MSIATDRVKEFPQTPGVYFFRDAKGGILYIGKATNLRTRVQSYFRGNEDRAHIESMMPSVFDMNFQETDSVLEALILESNLIKKHQPKYNVKEKDGKSFCYFAITKEEFPRVLIMRETDLEKIRNPKFKIQNKSQAKNSKIKKSNVLNTKYQILYTKNFGPYTSKKQMEIALKIIRKIFPFHSRSQKSEKGCLDFQLGRCPGPYVDAISKVDYRKNIHGIEMILAGKKKSLVKKLEKEMQKYASNDEFEKAAEMRNKVFALQHIRDIALIGREMDEDKLQISNNKSEINSKFKIQNSKFRIEAYDISNLSGQQAVGSMIVFEDGKPNKSEYRKFRIKTVVGANDVAMMKEVISRRMKNDWRQPDLIILDGGRGHLNMVEKLLQEMGFAIPLIAVAKGVMRKNLNVEIANLKHVAQSKFLKEIEAVMQDRNALKYITDEAHRFAIGYHRKIRKREYLTN